VGWRCDSSAVNSTFEGSADSLQGCVNAGLNEDNTVVYSFWEASQNICQGFTASECTNIVYNTSWASAAIQYGPGNPPCPTAGVPGDFGLVKQDEICLPESIVNASTRNDCFTTCDIEGANFFNFYSQDSSNVCSCTSCDSTSVMPSALVYQMCQTVNLSDYIDPSVVKLKPGAKRGAKPKQTVRYRLTITRAKGGVTLGSDVALRVDLSPYLTVKKAYVKGRVHNRPVAIYDTPADSVTWEDVGELLASAKGVGRLKFTIVARVAVDAPAGFSLNFRAYLNGAGLCDEQVGENSINVRSSHKSGK